MALDLLDTPVRMTWDFPDAAIGQMSVRLPAIADSLVDAGVFYVTLQGSPLLHPAVEEVLSILTGRCQLLLGCRGSSGELERLAPLPRAGCQLLLDASAFIDDHRTVDFNKLRATVDALRNLAAEPLICLTPLRNNLHNIPDLLRFCSERQITKFKLSNAHIGDSFNLYSAADLLRWQDLDSFRKVWREFLLEDCPLPILEIHDLFLWEIMTPGHEQSRSEYGGCQAGNSLGHVDCRGVVHPCAAWPQPLGSLPEQTLEEVWSGAARLAVREHIASTPVGCAGCSHLASCFGGCRGLALHLNRSAGERDLMCSGPR